MMERSAELERAALDLEIVLEANPRDAKAYCLLGAIQERLGQHAKSVASWTRAHDIAPEDLDIASGLGVALSRAGRHSEAARAFGRVVEKQPDSRAAMINFGLELRSAGLFDEARRVVETKRPQLSGAIARFCVPDLLDFLINQHASGTLYVRSGSLRASLSISEGRLVGGTAPGVATLAQLLIDAGALSSDVGTIEDASAHFLCCALVERGLAPAGAVKSAVDCQVGQVLRAMLTWHDGQFVFEDLDVAGETPAVLPDVSVDARAVLFDVIRQADEEQHSGELSIPPS